MALAADVRRHGDAGGAGADDGDLLAGLGLDGVVDGGQGLVGALPVGHVALEAADGDALPDVFVDGADGAELLALVLLRADAAADGRQDARLADDAEGLGVVALGDLMDEGGDVDGDGAALHARGVLALEATAGLDPRLSLGIALGHLAHVALADVGRLHGHLLLGDGEALLGGERAALDGGPGLPRLRLERFPGNKRHGSLLTVAPGRPGAGGCSSPRARGGRRCGCAS